MLAVDTRVFDSNLYRLASALPTLNSGSVRWSKTATGRHGVVEASRIWVKVLSEMLLSRGYRQVDTARIAAFVKRLAEVRGAALAMHHCEQSLTAAVFRRAVCMQSRESRWPASPSSGSSCLATPSCGVCWCALTGTFVHPARVACGVLTRTCTQENETGAAGVYLPDATEPEGACALSSCLWELTLLAEHAHAHVASNALQVAKMPVDDVPPPPLYGTASPEVSPSMSPCSRWPWVDSNCRALPIAGPVAEVHDGGRQLPPGAAAPSQPKEW